MEGEKKKWRKMFVCLCLRKRGNAAHFQLINTADRACWRKPHYAGGWRVGGWGGWIVITIHCSSSDAAECPQTCQNAGLCLQHERNGQFQQSGSRTVLRNLDDTFFRIFFVFFKQITDVNVTFNFKKSCIKTHLKCDVIGAWITCLCLDSPKFKGNVGP